MAQQPSEIRAHIKAEGASLKEDFEEIENRVKTALDWKIWYKNNTALALGGAAAGGVLLSLLIQKHRAIESEFLDSDELGSQMAEPRVLRPPSATRSHINNVLENTLSAIIGVAASKFQDYMSQALPGFREQYTDAQRRRFE